MRRLITFSLLVSIVACGSPPPPGAQSAPGGQSAPSAPRAQTISTSPRIVFLGDSLTAGLGLSAEQSFPSLISKKLKEKGLDYEVVNAGVSGDTTAGGLRRLDWSLEGDVRVLIVALGGNDALRGLPIDDMKKNLTAILDRAKARGIPVILAGMEAPPNNGIDYTTGFRKVYTDLAKQYDVRFIPFLLQGVAGDASLNQADGIHPNVRGAEIVAELVWKELEPLARRPNN
jgi:acyl-CoA thioesterase I